MCSLKFNNRYDKNQPSPKKVVCIVTLGIHLFIIVPKICTRAAQQAIVKLIRGCSIALQWKLSIDDSNEMGACFHVFFVYCNSKVDQRQIFVSVFKPITHYLSHISFVCRTSGTLRVFPSRSSTERCIGFLKI